MARNSSVILNRSDENEYLYFLSHLRKKVFKFLPVSMMMEQVFFIEVLDQGEKFPFIPS